MRFAYLGSTTRGKLMDLNYVTVEVEAVNEHGQQMVAIGQGPSVDEALDDAVGQVIGDTGDDSYVLNEWWAHI